MRTTDLYKIVIGRRVHDSVDLRTVATICRACGYDEDAVLDKLRRVGSATIRDDVGYFEIVRQ